MGINLLEIAPHVVSTDLSGYITFIYGPPKVGKTTFGSQMPDALILAFERGYNALPGVYPQDITSWGEMKQVVRELKRPEVKERYKSLVVDTVDVAADLCQKYICTQLGIDEMGEGGWATNSWLKYKKEFEDVFRTISQLGYAVLFISHDKEKKIKPQNSDEYHQITSSMQSTALAIVENMSDIIGYAHPTVTEAGSKVVLTLRSGDNSVRCGGRFKYIEPEIEFSYKALNKALRRAIEKESQENDNQYITDNRTEPPAIKEYDFDKLMKQFHQTINQVMAVSPEVRAPKITEIINRYLGYGKKVSDATPAQAELIYLIITDIENEFLTK